MKIASADILMESTHTAFTRQSVSESLQVQTGGRPPGNITNAGSHRASALVELSSNALAASATELGEEASDPLDSEPQLRLMATMIAMITGKPVRLMRLDELMAPGQPGSRPPEHANPATSTPSQGFGLSYDFNATRMEYEHVAFSASGTIRTADGQEIRFDVSFEMERSFVESSSFQLRMGDPALKDPLVLDFGGPAAQLQDARFAFDLNGDGELEDVPLLGGGRGFLAIDRNGNGRIDDGRELFGPTTGNGFAELALLDADGNGWIDAADPAYEQLRIWQPSADGQGTLSTLGEAGVGALYLGNLATPFQLRGASNDLLGMMRSSGIYLGQDGRVGTISQIDLAV